MNLPKLMFSLCLFYFRKLIARRELLEHEAEMDRMKNRWVHSGAESPLEHLEKIEPFFGLTPIKSTHGFGLEVAHVSQLSGAVHASIVRGDVIMSINGQPVHSLKDYRLCQWSFIVGDVVKIEVARSVDARTEVLDLEVHAKESNKFPQNKLRQLRRELSMPVYDGKLYSPKEALDELENLDAEAGFVIINGGEVGVIVKKIHQERAAFRAGFFEGENIFNFKGSPTNRNDEFISALLEGLPGDICEIRVADEKEKMLELGQ